MSEYTQPPTTNQNEKSNRPLSPPLHAYSLWIRRLVLFILLLQLAAISPQLFISLCLHQAFLHLLPRFHCLLLLNLLLELLARIKASKDEDAIVAGVAKKAGLDDDEAAADAPAAAGSLVDDDEIMQARPFNQRIDLPLSEEEEFGDGPMKDDGLPDVDEEELTRDKVKKASTQIMLAQDKKKKVKKRHRNASS